MNDTEIEPISKDLLHEKVAEAILSYIYRNGLKIGDKLPSERQLAIEFGIGRNSVRQGLCALEKEQILERLIGKGAFVKREVSADSIQLKLMKVNYKDLLEIKINLEQLAIRRAAESATPEQIAKLKAIAIQLNDLADQGIFSIAVDRKYHLALLECGGSPTLSQLVISLIDSLDCYTNMFGNVSGIWLKTISYHLDIANALEKKQVSFALAAHEYIYQYDITVLDRLELQNIQGKNS
ncbi:FCD domain-containing protein [uncultured Sphaerochaeta sp.]|uniref:FadR/GntR family transcriptional regulator n=1 Tax=uncultured Sphaerochaeta sp. TaxID=886478 RepID=UPI002A0A9A38|nr:FCD domain-containing protein [uncultured Sphaerochaeta sp.]